MLTDYCNIKLALRERIKEIKAFGDANPAFKRASQSQFVLL